MCELEPIHTVRTAVGKKDVPLPLQSKPDIRIAKRTWCRGIRPWSRVAAGHGSLDGLILIRADLRRHHSSDKTAGTFEGFANHEARFRGDASIGQFDHLDLNVEVSDVLAECEMKRIGPISDLASTGGHVHRI